MMDEQDDIAIVDSTLDDTAGGQPAEFAAGSHSQPLTLRQRSTLLGQSRVDAMNKMLRDNPDFEVRY